MDRWNAAKCICIPSKCQRIYFNKEGNDSDRPVGFQERTRAPIYGARQPYRAIKILLETSGRRL